MNQPPFEDEIAAMDNEAPIVAAEARQMPMAAVVTAFTILALALFFWLNGRRSEAAEVAPSERLLTSAPQYGAPPEIEAPGAPVAATQPAALPPPVAPPLPAPVRIPSSNGDYVQRMRAPSLIVDLGGGGERVIAQADQAVGLRAAVAADEEGAVDGPRRGPPLNDSEQFARRVSGDEPEQVRATTIRNLSYVIPQGAVIPGVLETAINSDLPGYTRAVVSQDVLSFDGKQVLIPRGSRLIGQYKSAVALGQSRAFIIWTRAIRPDGVSIQIGSPGTDELGRGGLDGDVNRHFFARFSGSILLSVLSAGMASLTDTPSTQISIGSPAAASGLASAATLGAPIPPTIKVKQGEGIRIFVARDLDFSGVATLP